LAIGAAGLGLELGVAGANMVVDELANAVTPIGLPFGGVEIHGVVLSLKLSILAVHSLPRGFARAKRI
jgi:hypothetical protein